MLNKSFSGFIVSLSVNFTQKNAFQKITGKQLITETLCAQAYIPQFKGRGVVVCVPGVHKFNIHFVVFHVPNHQNQNAYFFVSVLFVWCTSTTGQRMASLANFKEPLRFFCVYAFGDQLGAYVPYHLGGAWSPGSINSTLTSLLIITQNLTFYPGFTRRVFSVFLFWFCTYCWGKINV